MFDWESLGKNLDTRTHEYNKNVVHDVVFLLDLASRLKRLYLNPANKKVSAGQS